MKIATLIATLMSLLLAALDQTIVSTAGPAIQRDLHIEASLFAWITTSYLVASVMMVPIYGKLSDLYGRRPILLTGIGIFLAGSVLCGLANSALFLIAARALQGLGAAALFTMAFASVADLYAPMERARVQGLLGAVFGLSSVVGPLVGGLLTDTLGWRYVFFVNIPLGAIAVALIVLRMPALRPALKRVPRIDILGAIFLVLGIVPLLLALSLGRTALIPNELGYLWLSWQILGLFAMAIVAITLFITTELRVSDPLLDLRLFRNRTFAYGNAALFVLGATFLAGFVFLPLFMVNVVGLSATSAGLTTTPLMLSLVASATFCGQMASRTGRFKPLMLAGLILMIVAFGIMGFTLTTSSTHLQVTLKMMLVGASLGPVVSLYTLAIQNAVLPSQVGVATAAGSFFQQMGSSVGLALIGTIFATTFSDGLIAGMVTTTPDLAMKQALTDAVAMTYRIGIGLALLGFILTALLPEKRLRSGSDRPSFAAA